MRPQPWLFREIKMIDGFRYTDSQDVQDIALQMLKMMRPHRAVDFRKLRVGKGSDGGYIMLDDFKGLKAAYSLGINNDVAWDIEIAERGIPIFQYDHTINALPVVHKLFHWRKIGIGADPERSLFPLPMLMKQDGFEPGHGNLLLKCDIEGAEWDMLPSIPPELFQLFQQIVIELHGLGHIDIPEYGRKVLASVEALTMFHRVIHVHGNNNSAYCIVGGVPIPATIELTLVRADAYRLSPSTETFPTKLDRPCWPGRADYSLGTFCF
jgi:hypothetical protein